MLRRHPDPLELGAWFDGESSATVGPHVARCSRCRKRVSELSRVRAWIRAQPFFAMGDEEPSRRAPSGSVRWKAAAAVSMVLVGFLLSGPDHSGETNAMRRAAREAASRENASPPNELTATGPDQPGSPAEPATQGSEKDDDARSRAGTGAPTGLRLGLIVPMTGPLANEAAEVVRAVRGRVAAANASGGIGGVPVTLEVAAAENKKAVAALREKVSVLVGGFGSEEPPKGVWLLPADPNVTGPNVVSAEVSAHSAGAHVASLLPQVPLLGPVGVVRGPGPEAAMEAGVASRARTTAVPAQPGTTCDAEVSALRQSGSVALVIAAPPDLTARCLSAAARASWHPALGTFVPPSAAYARVGSLPEALGAKTVLALPWPTSPAAGAARFRASTQSTSYRALVSFSAVELAIDIARQQGTVSMASVAAGLWRSDLLELGGTTSRARLVVAGPHSWLPVSAFPPTAGPFDLR